MCCAIGALDMAAARPFWENPLPPLPEPLPAVADALESVDARPGVTYLVELHGAVAARQWLVTVSDGPPARKEAKTTDVTLHVSTGDRFSFSAEDVSLRVSTQGPWLAGGKQPHRSLEADVAAPRGFLDLGFNRFCQFLCRLHDQGMTEGSLGISVGTNPFAPEAVEHGRARARVLGLSSEDLRAAAGTVPSFSAYFAIIQSTEGLSDILYDLIDKPSMLSVMLNGLDVNFILHSAGVARIDGSAWGLPATTPCYRLPVQMNLNGKSALYLDLVVTDPANNGLANVAGVAGFVAIRPDDPARMVVARISRHPNSIPEAEE
jgi:hypothetical protein